MKTVEQLLEEAQAKRRELDTVISYLEGQLGRSPSASNGAGQTDITPLSSGPGWHVNKGEFYGMSGPKAAFALLSKGDRSRPLSTQQIYDLIIEGGCTKVSNRDVLYRNLFRDPKFHKVGRGVWGLTAWYPAAAKKLKTTTDDNSGHDSADVESGEENEGEEGTD
jgi:hypothetical protein